MPLPPLKVMHNAAYMTFSLLLSHLMLTDSTCAPVNGFFKLWISSTLGWLILKQFL